MGIATQSLNHQLKTFFKTKFNNLLLFLTFFGNRRLSVESSFCSMISSNKSIKERLKKFVVKRNHFKYRRFNMDKEGASKGRSFGKICANILQRFISVFVRFLFKNVIYGEKGQSMPPIKNLLLLEPATVLAMKIRTKKVDS